MTKRSYEEWVDLIKQQPASGLTIKGFCRQHQLTTSTFYARKANLANVDTAAPFVKVKVEARQQVRTSQQPISLQHQTGLWTFPCSLPASYLLEIIRGLQTC